ncbi:ABC transporter ATP-binding protein [Sanyastnella coralliicola]|uniref:ABC transporter ATP-binding protein n=1 Tax=Sanyastnella coralliicola TaxID=3069118 RepID=UPI0027BA6F94|nr:ATP-binding cassette domain-containing protein [Longitalea sp. SCSIO 12813]
MIRINNLSKSFGTEQVLKEIDVTFGPGEVHGIVGKNGAGKTTLFRCLCGLESYEGEVTPAPKQLKQHLGYLQTEPYTLPLITGREYIQLLCSSRRLPQVDIEGKNLFNLPLDKYVTAYSTGMRKKLALNAILLQENEVFILDEPFNGLDLESNIMVTELIQELKKAGKTIILSSHIFSTLTGVCDEIHFLEDGSFSGHYKQDQFAELEEEMRQKVVGQSIKGLIK